MSNGSNNEHSIKVYKKTYKLPKLQGGKLVQLQSQIRKHNEHLTKGRVVQKGFLFVGQRRQPLNPEERYQELDRMIRNYELMINFLKDSENDYQRFFQGLAQEISEVIIEKSNEILEEERKSLEFKNSLGDDLTPDLMVRMKSIEKILFETAKYYGYGAVLMLKKLDLMSKTLKVVTSDPSKNKEKLANALRGMRIDRDIYELEKNAHKKFQEAVAFANLAVDFEKSLKPAMGDVQGLLAEIAKADQNLVNSVMEIQKIANFIENKRFGDIEKDRESENFVNFLMTSEMNRGRIQDALDQMQGVSAEAAFDAELFGAGKEVSLSDCLGNIRDFLDLKLDKFKTDRGVIAVPAIEVNEPDVSFYAPEPSEDVIKLDLGSGVILELLRVPAGSFAMGEHQVTLREFFIGKYAVTNQQWQAVMKAKGSANCDKKFQGDLQPVVGVSWHEARAFCEEVSVPIGITVRLPTEAEWEYAARGGNHSKGYEYAGSNNLDEVGWYDDNSGAKTSPVGQKKANELGVYDMSGNVWEWCLDEWHDSLAAKPEKLKSNDNEPWGDLNVDENDNRYRLLRGGSWYDIARNCRAALRSSSLARFQGFIVGFRLLLASSS